MTEGVNVREVVIRRHIAVAEAIAYTVVVVHGKGIT